MNFADDDQKLQNYEWINIMCALLTPFVNRYVELRWHIYINTIFILRICGERRQKNTIYKHFEMHFAHRSSTMIFHSLNRQHIMQIHFLSIRIHRNSCAIDSFKRLSHRKAERMMRNGEMNWLRCKRWMGERACVRSGKPFWCAPVVRTYDRFYFADANNFIRIISFFLLFLFRVFLFVFIVSLWLRYV